MFSYLVCFRFYFHFLFTMEINKVKGLDSLGASPLGEIEFED